MEFLLHLGIAAVLVVVAASSDFSAQMADRDKLPYQASIPDARRIIGQSVVAAERSASARSLHLRGSVIESAPARRDAESESRRYENDSGQRRRFEQLVERNGQLPSAEERKKTRSGLRETGSTKTPRADCAARPKSKKTSPSSAARSTSVSW